MTGCSLARFLAAALLYAGAGLVHADDADANSPDSLRAKYGVLQDSLRQNQFRSPLHMESSKTRDSAAGEIYAVITHQFATVGTALESPGNWCDILILHLNTKYCHASTADQGDVLNVSIGKKTDQSLEQAYRVDFAFKVATRTADYLQVRLDADEGPLSTRDYRMVLEAIPLETGETFIHLAYSYAYGLLGRVAMQTYLGTTGSDKVGFTVAGIQPGGNPSYVGGMRGALERNTMRYYLAIEAFLGALSAPPQERLETRLHDWFAAVEGYPRQLHELERGAYLDMKHREVQRQEAELPEAGGRKQDKTRTPNSLQN